jgi:hypothetical protein
MDGLTAEDEKKIESTKESFVFQAEVNRLMDIIINSLCKSLQALHALAPPCAVLMHHHSLMTHRQEQGGLPS